MIWHDVECGSYTADLALWRELAAAERVLVLDLGAGTGRVAPDLASQGHEVVALDIDEELLDALRSRGHALPIQTVVADARDFDLGREYGLILAPMQTVQLLPGPTDRASMLRAVRAHLHPGGLFAASLANAVDTYGELEAPVPDVREVDGEAFFSRPTAVRDDGDGFVLERLREHVSAEGERTATENLIRLARVTAEQLAAAAAEVGLRPERTRYVDETDDHVGSEVAMLRA
ncbi:MAG: hypothetical protein AVDCRST_MAG85-4086 [uncultured Solirubrobacteraceae bacterium]|uniref:Methyltransferase domain-containing protein n=1 Tax=uncultured Solirubrobacteraceae bacterium TaxID=1162706 RepID=A0A6J4TY65_9ACTN|nr:MAG: hypothetical protein AVDCRST_MAG85-4086 [uncultured Solirubrobacteraceae bacterium]